MDDSGSGRARCWGKEAIRLNTDGGRVGVGRRPNTRVQRTRVARLARDGSPLTRHPLGGPKG
jgi:hypothetical protein